MQVSTLLNCLTFHVRTAVLRLVISSTNHQKQSNRFNDIWNYQSILPTTTRKKNTHTSFNGIVIGILEFALIDFWNWKMSRKLSQYLTSKNHIICEHFIVSVFFHYCIKFGNDVNLKWNNAHMPFKNIKHLLQNISFIELKMIFFVAI